MKILQLVTRRQYRGAEVFAANLSEELIKLGHEIIFVGLYKNDDNELIVPQAKNLDLINEKKSSFSPVLVKNLVRLVKRVKPDIIQCNGSDTLKYMVTASYLLPKTPILYRNISMISKWLTGDSHKILYQFLFKRIDHVSSVGSLALADFIKTSKYPEEKTSVIRRGIPVKTVDAEKTRQELLLELGLTDDARIVMHIGNFSPEKNHIFLLDVFSKIAAIQPNIKLICLGNGELFNIINSEILKRDLENTVFLLGFRKDIPNFIAAADCFVLSSLVEGVPGVVLEAAVQKVPSIATNVGGVKEVLIDGATGFIINNFDPDCFTNRILELIRNPSLRKQLGENAYKLAMKEFDPILNAKKFEVLYKQIINSKGE